MYSGYHTILMELNQRESHAIVILYLLSNPLTLPQWLYIHYTCIPYHFDQELHPYTPRTIIPWPTLPSLEDTPLPQGMPAPPLAYSKNLARLQFQPKPKERARLCYVLCQQDRICVYVCHRIITSTKCVSFFCYIRPSEIVTAHTHTYIYMCTYVCMYVCMSVCTYVCMYVCMYVCVCVPWTVPGNITSLSILM